jgi:hypothetical protein
MSGLKISVPASKTYIDTLTAMGAMPTPLPWGETLAAVKQGVVDGLEGSGFTKLGNTVYETGARNVALPRHILGTCGVYISTTVWNSIPAKYRAIEGTKILSDGHANTVKELESFGVKFNEVDGAAFRKALAPLYSEQPGMTAGIFNAVFRELGAMRKIVKLVLGNFEVALSATFLTVTVLVVIINVILRYGFKSGLFWVEEVATVSFIWSVFVGAAAAYRHTMHIGIDLITSRRAEREARGAPREP